MSAYNNHKIKVLAIEPHAHAVYRGIRVDIEANGRVIASAFNLWKAWTKAWTELQKEQAA